MSDKVAAIVEQLSQQNPFNGAEGLPDPPRPSETAIPRDRPPLEQMPYIQQQISTLTYNHLPRTFFSLEKHRSLQSILLTAKEALSEALPIRCLEATFVALHYTQCLRDVDRIPLSFKSEASGNTYRHIVLIVRTRSTPSLYGALGLSRKSTLMYKPMTFRSLFDVVMDYKHEYEVLGHHLADIKLGIAITHDEHSKWDPCWRFIALKLNRYCEGAPAEAPDAASSTVAPRSFGSSGSPSFSKSGGHASETIFRAPNADSTATASPLLHPPPPLSFNASSSPRDARFPSARGESHLDESCSGVLGGSQDDSNTPRPHLRHPPSPAASRSILPPTTPHSDFINTAINSNTDSTANKSSVTCGNYAPLSKLLSNYTRLLPTICDQYYKTIGTIDPTNRALKLCYMDLDTAEKDAGIENQRRLQYIAELQSPLSPEARRVAASRQLHSAKKERTISRQPVSSSSGGAGGDVSGDLKRRQASSNEGRPAKWRSPASPGLVSGEAKKVTMTKTPTATTTSATSAATIGTAATSTPQQHCSPRTRLTSTTTPAMAAATAIKSSSSVTAAPPPLPMVAFAPIVAPTSVTATLAKSRLSLREPWTFEGTVVKAHSICSSTSAEQTATEGYATPRGGPHRIGEGESDPDAPPLTPRNYDERKLTTPYDTFLRTPSSTSNLFSSTTSLNDMTAQPTLSP